MENSGDEPVAVQIDATEPGGIERTFGLAIGRRTS